MSPPPPEWPRTYSTRLSANSLLRGRRRRDELDAGHHFYNHQSRRRAHLQSRNTCGGEDARTSMQNSKRDYSGGAARPGSSRGARKRWIREIRHFCGMVAPLGRSSTSEAPPLLVITRTETAGQFRRIVVRRSSMSWNREGRRQQPLAEPLRFFLRP
jgi:hypothetical protein